MITKEQRREVFREKNNRRKLNKSNKHAREMRRILNGAFGKENTSVYNLCSEGTTAIKKAETKSKDESNEDF